MDDAVERGRMTRDDAEQLVADLIKIGPQADRRGARRPRAAARPRPRGQPAGRGGQDRAQAASATAKAAGRTPVADRARREVDRARRAAGVGPNVPDPRLRGPDRRAGRRRAWTTSRRPSCARCATTSAATRTASRCSTRWRRSWPSRCRDSGRGRAVQKILCRASRTESVGPRNTLSGGSHSAQRSLPARRRRGGRPCRPGGSPRRSASPTPAPPTRTAPATRIWLPVRPRPPSLIPAGYRRQALMCALNRARLVNRAAPLRTWSPRSPGPRPAVRHALGGAQVVGPQQRPRQPRRPADRQRRPPARPRFAGFCRTGTNPDGQPSSPTRAGAAPPRRRPRPSTPG